MKILCSVPKRNLNVFYTSTLFQLQVFFLLFVQLTDLGFKNPLQLAHSGYQDTKIFGTKVWGGSLDFHLPTGLPFLVFPKHNPPGIASPSQNLLLSFHLRGQYYINHKTMS